MGSMWDLGQSWSASLSFLSQQCLSRSLQDLIAFLDSRGARMMRDVVGRSSYPPLHSLEAITCYGKLL